MELRAQTDGQTKTCLSARARSCSGFLPVNRKLLVFFPDSDDEEAGNGCGSSV